MNNEVYEAELGINTKAFSKQCDDVENRAERASKFIENLFKEKKVNLLTDVPEGTEKQLRAMQTKYLGLNAKLQDTFSQIDKPTYLQERTFSALSKVYNQNLDLIEQGLAELSNQAKETKDDLEDIDDKASTFSFKAFFASMEKGFDRGFKKVKRFTLGLLGVRSAYFAINKAMHNYLQNDQELTDKMQSIWTGLGVLIAPIVEVIADATLRLTKYILYIAQAVTKIDFLDRAMKKQQKTMKGSLSTLDEITNIGEKSNLATLAEMLEKTEINTEWADKLASAIKPVYDFIKGIVDFSIEHPEIIAVILGGTAVLGLISSIIGAGPLGLAGIALALSTIAGISLANIIGQMHKLWEETKAYTDLVNQNLEKDKSLNDKIKDRQAKGELLPGSKEAELLTTQTKNNINAILTQIDKAESQKKWYNFWRWGEIDKEVEGLSKELQSAYDRVELLTGKKVDIEFDIMVNYKKVPGAISGGFRGLNSFDVGTNYVPNDQLAMVHEGEAIVPKQFNKQEFFGNDEETKEILFEIMDLLRENSDKVPVFKMDSREFAKATYEAYQNEGKRLGVNTSIERS